ncbi:MAG: MBL fold metallo-hydrolase [Steroidobacteraceae bacterium]
MRLPSRQRTLFPKAACLMLALVAATTQAAQPRRETDKAVAVPEAAVEVALAPVQGNVFVVTGIDVNVVVQIGDGVLLVDTPPPALADKVLALARNGSNKRLTMVINTHADPEHIAGDEALILSGTSARDLANRKKMALAAGGPAGGVQVLGHENLLNRLTDKAQAIPGATLTSEYYLPSRDFFMNGDPIVVYHEPNAHTDGDSIVFFRRSDVVVTGDIFVPERYPLIDLERGGSIQGLIKAVNHILELTIPANFQEGGTLVVPGHGRICDEADVTEYREMLTIVRDRVQDMIGKGMSLERVLAARPTLDYDTTYDGARGGVTAAQFVTAVYKSLTAPASGAASGATR